MRNRFICLVVLFSFFCAAASAVNLVADQSSLAVSVDPGHTKLLVLTITSSGAPISGLTIAATTQSGVNWLQVNPTSATSTPIVGLIVFVDATKLTQNVYNGSIKVTASGAANSPLTIPVTLNVGTPVSGSFSVDATSLSFTGQAGGSAPSPQQLNVTSNPAGVSFLVSAATTGGGNWLQISTTSGTAPAPVTVSVNTAGLTAGSSYSGTVSLKPSSGAQIDVPVSLTLSSGSALSVNTTGLQFYFQTNSPAPASQTFSVTGGPPALNFTVTATPTDGTGWLSATPPSGTTPQTVTVSVAPSGLAAGVYKGKVTVSSPDAANASVIVPVTLTVSSQALLTVSTPPAPFVYQTGDPTAPATQSVAIGSLGDPLSFTVTTNTSDGGAWLAVSPTSGRTPQSLTIAVSPTSLSPGSYSGTVIVTAPAATNSPVSIPVTLTIGSSNTLATSAQSVVLNYQIGATGTNELSQPVTVTSTGGPVTATASATTSTSSCGSRWLQVVPDHFSTPSTINVILDPTGLTQPQSCLGSIVLAGGGAPIQILVTANVSKDPFLNIKPLSVNLTAPYQSEAVSQSIALSTTNNTSATFAAAASTSNSGPWLFVSPAAGSTPGSLSITASPNVLGVGNYSGTVSITSPAFPQGRTIPVTFKVTPSTTATVNPASLTFTQAVGGAPPAAQKISVSATAGSQSFVMSLVPGTLPAAVFSASPVNGSTPAVLTIAILQNLLPAGSYDGSLNIALPAAGSTPITVPITLKVTDTTTGSSVAATPATLAFSYQAGGEAPASQQINATATGDAVNVTASAAAEAGGKWLAVTPASGMTPASFTISVNPTGLAIASYTGAVTLTPAGAAGGSPVTIPVRLDVTAPPVLTPKISAIANAASGVRASISPGQIVTLGGEALGPATGVTLNLTSDGKVDTTLGGTQVFFDEVAAPLLYVSASQINAIVPYEVAGRGTVQVTAAKQGLRSDLYTIQIGAAAPGIFTMTQNGHGQGAILNQDNSYNSPATPAERGSIVQVFGTGEGVTQPPAATGSVTQSLHIVPPGKVSATVGGAPAEVMFAGAAPQAVAGLFQVNVRIPENALTGDVLITINMAGVNSQTGVTVALK